jgi:hypothetical protein
VHRGWRRGSLCRGDGGGFLVHEEKREEIGKLLEMVSSHILLFFSMGEGIEKLLKLL